MTMYIIRVDVEFRHDGQAVQHNWHAEVPQQQANYILKNFICKFFPTF